MNWKAAVRQRIRELKQEITRLERVISPTKRKRRRRKNQVKPKTKKGGPVFS